MRVNVSEKMKEWVAGYIRSHRREATISIHAVYSKFNEDFKATFGIDPVLVVNLLAAYGFIKKGPSKGGVSIWLPEDEGKGKRRPFRPRKAEVNGTAASTTKNQPTPSADQNGESEMTKTKSETKEQITIEPHYSFEKVPHPETSEVNVLELIRHLMKHLASKFPGKPEMDGGYAIMKLSLSGVGVECGLTTSDMVGLTAIMQHMGLVRLYGKSTWGVLHTKAADYFITARSYELARKKWSEGTKRNAEMVKLQKKLQEPEGDVTTSETKASSTMFNDEALEFLAEAERLAEELQKAQQRIAELEAERDKLQTELAERPTSVDAAKQALQERLAALKKVSTS